MRQINLTIKQLDRLCILAIVLISIAGGYLVVNHRNRKIQQFSIEREILSKRMNEASLATANLKDLKTALAETQSELRYLNEKIPSSGEIGTFLKQLNTLMVQRSVGMISLQPQTAIKEKDYLKIPIQLVFTGSFNNIYRLMDELEHMNRMVIMDNMVISKLDDKGQCQVELTINVFERSESRIQDSGDGG